MKKNFKDYEKMEAEDMIHTYENIKGQMQISLPNPKRSAQRKMFQKLDWGLPKEDIMCYLCIQHLA